ncbi:MAG: MFS transporter [Candidatus Eremiobacteraeota bacterium]|nr:MFS transporter [Candidatus Eremiobacteraeota bacterium]
MRQLFREREFLAYFLARQSSVIAGTIEAVAIGWQIYSLRHSPFDLGLVGLILFLPQLLLALPAGVLADRVDRRIVCVSVALVEMAGLAMFVALTAGSGHSIGVYFAAVGLIGIAHAVGIPAERSLLAGIVHSDHFVRAQAMSSSLTQLFRIAGPALGGVLIAISTPVAFGLAGAGYALAAVGFACLKPRPAVVDDVPLMQAAIEGVRFIFARKILLGAISLDLFAVLFGGATALLPVYAAKILDVGPTGFGALRSAPAVGAAVVAAVISRRPIARKAGPLLFWCVAGFGVSTIIFGLSKNFWLTLGALMCLGGFDMVSVVIRSVLVQLRTPDEMRGRVGAVENIFIGASNELGEFESGTLAGLIGAEASVVAGGIATLVVIAIWALGFPALRTFDRLQGDSMNG